MANCVVNRFLPGPAEGHVSALHEEAFGYCPSDAPRSARYDCNLVCDCFFRHVVPPMSTGVKACRNIKEGCMMAACSPGVKWSRNITRLWWMNYRSVWIRNCGMPCRTQLQWNDPRRPDYWRGHATKRGGRKPSR